MSKKIYSGRYEVQEFLADGELGTIYKACDSNSFDRIVALKVIHSHLSSDAGFLTRFREETRKTTRLLTHPNIVNILDVEHDDGTDYLVMEYFPSTNLRDHLRTHGKFRIPDATHVICQIAEALLHTHSSNLLHRHIKPANILLNNTQHAKLTDFGLATAMSEPSVIPDGQLIGTLISMSPEQVRQVGLNGQTDLFSLGLVFYELVTGEHLWKTLPASTIYNNLQNEHTIALIHFPPDIPQTVQSVINNLLQFDPKDRIQNTQTLITRLKHLEPSLHAAPKDIHEEDPDATIVIPRNSIAERREDDTTEKINLAPKHRSSTQSAAAPLAGSGTKQTSDDPQPRLQDFEDDPAAKAKDPAKPYYFVDDSHSFNKHREEVEAKKSLFADQFPTPNPHSVPSRFTLKKMLAGAFIVLFGATLYWNQSLFMPSQPSQETLVFQDTDGEEIQETHEQRLAESQTSELNQHTENHSNAPTKEIVQQANVVPDAQSTNMPQQTKAPDDVQITKLPQRTSNATNVQTEEPAKQTQIATDDQVANQGTKVQPTAKIQIAERAKQPKAANTAQTPKLVQEIQAKADAHTVEPPQQGKVAAQTASRDKQAPATADTQTATNSQMATLGKQDQTTADTEAARAQAEALYQQAKAATEARAAELAREAQKTANAQAIEHSRKTQTTKAETQALLSLLEKLRGSVAKKDLSALKRQSTMSESRYRMLKDLFSRYQTVEISIGDVRRTEEKATATLQITKLIRPNGVIVRPHPIVQNIKVTVLKDKEDWNRPAW